MIGEQLPISFEDQLFSVTLLIDDRYMQLIFGEKNTTNVPLSAI